MESRPIGPEAAFQGSCTREGTRVTDRARRVGTGPDPAAEHQYVRPAPSPPTPGLAGLPGPASLGWVFPPRADSWVGGYYPCPTTHPYRTRPGPMYSPPSTARCGAPWACTYGCFGPGVGEPRVPEHTRISGSRTVNEALAGSHGRLTGFMTVLD